MKLGFTKANLKKVKRNDRKTRKSLTIVKQMQEGHDGCVLFTSA